ncbi:MAG: hypothetical protein ACYTHN_15940 [Planctomycetota bacterium]|jgi:hypothetical protein
MQKNILFASLIALVALAQEGWAASPTAPCEPRVSISRFLATRWEEGFGEPIEEKDKTLPEMLETDEEGHAAYEANQAAEAALKRRKELRDQAIERYAQKKLKNLRFSITVFSMRYREMKEGSAGWGHYDDLFSSGVMVTRYHAGGTSVYVPTGGFELAFVGMPFYHIHIGISYELFTGRHFMGNEFRDFFISSYYIGLRFNILNEYVATQKFAEMFNFKDPTHITGLQIYLKGHVGLCVLSRVTFQGNLTGPGDSTDTYFNQTESFGYFIGAGFEYRLFTLGFFFETGFSFMQHPRIARPQLDANHFRTFPVMAGITLYFGG